MIQVRSLKKTYGNGIQALRGVDLSVETGETVALVGESGCGKSTLAKILMGLEAPSGGEVSFSGQQLVDMNASRRAQFIQMVFQDPSSSLNPRHKIQTILEEPLIIQSSMKAFERKIRIRSILSEVGFDESVLNRYPHMFSGGQKQRLVLARALVLGPKILICDEPVSALDVSVQAQVLNLIVDLQKKLNLTVLFISHDLHVVKWVSHRVYVMNKGQIVESAPKEVLFRSPRHPYTRLLLDSTPRLGEEPKEVLAADFGGTLNADTQCLFADRCKDKVEICLKAAPKLKEDQAHAWRCVF